MKKPTMRALVAACVVAMGAMAGHAATLVQKNAFAYDIRVNASNKMQPVVTYKLNGLSSKVEIETWINGNKVATQAGTTNQSNSVTMNSLAGQPAGRVTYKVVVNTKTTVTAPTIIQDVNTAGGTGKFSFFAPFGVTVNNCTDAETFGRVLALESRNVTNVYGGSANSGYHSSTTANGRGAMIYAFDPQLTPIANDQAQGKYGFNAGLNVNSSAIIGDFQRIKYSADGRLFLASADNASRYGMYELNPDNLNGAATPMLSTKIQAWGFDVVGSGSDLKMIVVTNSAETANTTSATTIYDLGAGNKLTNGTVVRTMSGSAAGGTSSSKQWVNGRTVNVLFDKDGESFFQGQYRGSPTEIQPQWCHVQATATGTVNKTDNTTVFNGGGMAYNKDHTLLAMVTANNKVSVYTVTSNAGQLPTMTKACDVTPGIGNPINAIAFDYANNIYFVGNSAEKLVSFQLPASVAGSSQTVPAPSSQVFERTVTVAQPQASISASGQDVTVSWSKPAVEGDVLQRYLIYYLAPGASDWTPLVDNLSPETTSYTHRGAAPGEGKYMVCAIASNGTATNSAHQVITVAAPVAPIENLTGTAAWTTDNKQTATLSWKAVTGAMGYNIYLNGTKVAGSATTTATVDLPMVDRDVTNANTPVNTFTVKAVKDGTEGAGADVTVFHLPFGALTTTAQYEVNDKGCQSALVSWNTPANGQVAFYNVYGTPVNDDGTDGEQVKLASNLEPNVNAWKHVNIKNKTWKYQVNVGFTTKIRTDASTATNNVKGSVSDPVVGLNIKTAPVIDKIKTYAGYNSVEAEWAMTYGGPLPSYYKVYRDGIRVIDQTDRLVYIDKMVPDGMHEYVVVAVFSDGTQIKSEPVKLTEEIFRDQAIVQYGLERIYNYPIMTQAEWTAAGSPADAVVVRADSRLHNLKAKVGNYGAAGDVYRQGVYRDGMWYLSQLTDRPADENNMIANSTDADDNISTGTYKGGIVTVDANDPRTMDKVGKRIRQIPAMSNQSLAMDNSKTLRFFYRMPKDNTPSVTGSAQYLFYMPNAKYGVTARTFDDAGTASNSNQTVDIASLNLYGGWKGTGQVYRTHYLAAAGDAATDKGATLYMAMNSSKDLYILRSGEDAMKSHVKVTAPDEYKGGTENYAFPIVDREDEFIHVLRSNALLHGKLNADGTCTYSPVHVGHSYAVQAGGITFAYKDRKAAEKELFCIFPQSVHSNSAGHFTIEMAERKPGETYTTCSLENMIPITGSALNELTEGAAGNSNSVWFGTENDEANNCVYIYVYVPGVRFAKYRFYSYADYPAAEPELNVTVQHNEADTDITHFAIDYSWERPELYAHAEGHNNFEVKDYIVELYDTDMNLLRKDNVIDLGYNGMDGKNPVYTLHYDQDAKGVKHVDSQEYTVRVTPRYKPVDGESIIVGETGAAQNDTDYEPYMHSLTAKAYRDANNENLYLVELNADHRPGDIKAQYPEPPTNFVIEQSVDGGTTWQKVPNMWMYIDGKACYAPDDEEAVANHGAANAHSGVMPGNYRFEDENAGEIRTAAATSTVDKGTSMVNGVNEPVVAFHYTTANPADLTYRITAKYADNNPYIAKQAAVTATTEVSDMTAVTAVGVDAGDGVAVSPVPARTMITVTSPQAIRTVRIYTMTGALARVEEGNEAYEMTLNISDLAAGNYLVIVNDLPAARMIKR